MCGGECGQRWQCRESKESTGTVWGFLVTIRNQIQFHMVPTTRALTTMALQITVPQCMNHFPPTGTVISMSPESPPSEENGNPGGLQKFLRVQESKWMSEHPMWAELTKPKIWKCVHDGCVDHTMAAVFFSEKMFCIHDHSLFRKENVQVLWSD